MVDAMCAKLQDVNTFGSIAKIIGYGRKFVADPLKAEFLINPDTMFKVGDDYRIPRATAARFICALYAY